MAAGSHVENTNLKILVIETCVIARFMGFSVRQIYLWHCLHEWRSRSHANLEVKVKI